MKTKEVKTKAGVFCVDYDDFEMWIYLSKKSCKVFIGHIILQVPIKRKNINDKNVLSAISAISGFGGF